MQCFKSFLLFVIVCTGFFTVQAQQKQWLYRFYNTAHGLPSSEILTITKDKQGFLWIGSTAGLSRYDGYRFYNYAYTAKNKALGSVNKLAADSAGRLWIASSTGLFCYVNNQVIELTDDAEAPQGVNDILVDEKNALWMATENGPASIPINQFDFAGNKTVNLSQYVLRQWNSKETDRYKRRVLLVSKADDGTIYFAQPGNVYRFAENEITLIHSHADALDIIQTLFAVNSSTVYFDCSSSEMNKVEKGVHSHSLYSQFYQPNQPNNTKGFWYAGTSGVFYFHPQTGTASVLVHLLKDDIIWPSAAIKDANCIWAATHDGLIRIKPALFTVYDWRKLSIHNDFYSATQLKNGTILLGSNRGKIFAETKTGFAYYKDGVVPKAEAKAMYEDERGWLWTGSGYQGLSVLQNGKLTQYTMKDGVHNLTLFHFLKTSKGKLYATGSEGTTEIIVDAGQKISFKKHLYSPAVSQKAHFYSAIEGPDGRVWLAGEEGIVYLKNDSLHPFRFKNMPVVVNSMIKDEKGTVWLATNARGILQCKFNAANELEIIKQLTLNEGLHTLSYLHLLADKNNRIWAASSAGISCIIPGQNQYRVLNFDESDGFLKPGYSYIRLFQGNDERIWVVSTTGFASFSPAVISLNHAVPGVYITDVVSKKQNAPVLQKKFTYNDNAFTFQFTALDYAAQEGITFHYRMEGLDTGFTNSGGIQSISYENLAPGNYAFRVKAVSTKGAVYTFVITPPFWKQWWFRLFAVLFFTASAYLFMKRREKKIKEKEAQKTELEKFRTVNLQHQLEIEQVTNFFASSISSHHTVDEMLWDVTKNCISKLGFEDFVIYLKDEQRNVLAQKAAWGSKTTTDNNIINAIEIPVGKGIVGSVAQTGKAEIINDTSLDKRYIQDDAMRFSEITVPLISDNKVIGVIDSEHPQKNFYTQRHLQILITIASLCTDRMDKIKAEAKTRAKEIEVLKLSKDLADWQLSSLKAQMNPHFLFNVMNSIQQFTLKNDSDNANRYISKFSTLLRKVLHTSQQKYIPLEEEAEQLKLYLDIEQLRLGKDFSYKVTVDEEIEADALKIPGMLIQPFAENSLKHGLAAKEGEKKLSIHFKLMSETQVLAIITDNGIGRQKAQELKEQQQKFLPHQSRGIELIKERLQLLHTPAGEELIVFHDLKDAEGRATGTLVEVKLPVLFS
jgi:ligand-binding sensor domain-containing protein/putative methionine-R-sulfoxide reductase with GAF domain